MVEKRILEALQRFFIPVHLRNSSAMPLDFTNLICSYNQLRLYFCTSSTKKSVHQRLVFISFFRLFLRVAMLWFVDQLQNLVNYGSVDQLQFTRFCERLTPYFFFNCQFRHHYFLLHPSFRNNLKMLRLRLHKYRLHN